MEKISVSIIIPTYHRNDLLRQCLACIRTSQQKAPLLAAEVIVSDDGRETTAERLIRDEFPEVQWVAGPQRGPAANRNKGASVARGDWFIFTDDDCLPSEAWLKELGQVISSRGSNYQVIEGLTRADRPQQSYGEESPINTSGGNLWSCNFAITQQAFRALGGFDEGFPYPSAEDIDFNLRVQKNGLAVFFAPKAVVIHPWRPKGSWKKYAQAVVSHRFLYRKHYADSLIDIRKTRAKIFLGKLLSLPKQLIHFRGRGWQYALREIYLYFRLIFI